MRRFSGNPTAAPPVILAEPFEIGNWESTTHCARASVYSIGADRVVPVGMREEKVVFSHFRIVLPPPATSSRSLEEAVSQVLRKRGRTTFKEVFLKKADSFPALPKA